MTKEFVIDDSTSFDVTTPPGVRRGYVPRDYSVDPPEMFDPPSQLPLIPRSEWDARIKEQEERQSSLEHLRDTTYSTPMLTMNQGNMGYCWSHSVAQAVMLQRAVSGLPYVRLSAYAVAAKIKNFRDEGGWCGLAAKFIRDVGIPSEEFWPQLSMDRRHDNPSTWENAARYRIQEGWFDLTRPVWNQVMTFDQVASCLLMNVPCALDFNWWGHSVCGVRLVKTSNGYGIRIWNSWGDNWGTRGFATLVGNRAIPDGAIAVRVTRASS